MGATSQLEVGESRWPAECVSAEVMNFEALRRDGLIDDHDLSLFGLVDEPEEGWDWLLAHGLKAHTPAGERAAEAEAEEG